MPATINDVAQRANVAKSTVSKYINHGNLREDVKARVEQAIQELNFVPNELARGLKTMKSFTIGVIIPTLDSSFTAQIISAMEQELQNYGYGVLVSDCRGNKDVEKEALKFFQQKTVDAYVLLPSYLSKEELRELNKPVVLFDCPIEGFPTDTVLIDNEAAGYEAAKYLLERGHKNIGLLLGGEGVYTSDLRAKGALKACAEFGVTLKSENVMHTNYTVKTAIERTLNVMQREDPPTALIAFNADTTLGCVMALNQLQLSIPGDVSVFGFDNFSIAKFSNPAITIVHQNHQKMGEEIAKLLIKRLHDPKRTPRTRTVDFQMIEGGSVKTI